MSGPGPYGPGPRSDPHHGPDGRREVPFGPEISWPNGFRQLDPEARLLLESGYGSPGYGGGPGYRQPAVDDYGYGDPGYADPAYDGPRSAYGAPAPRGGGRGIAVPGAPPDADGGDGGPGRASWASAAEWYGHPRLDDPPHGAPPDELPADPRLGGMRYDRLQYEEPPFAGPGYDEPLDDESWLEQLRDSAPTYPQRHAGLSGPHQRPDGPGAGSVPGVPGYGQQPGYGQPSGYGRGPGHGQQPGYPQLPAHGQPSGYGQPRNGLGAAGPAMSAAPETGPGPWPGGLAGLGQPGPAFPADLAFPSALAAQGGSFPGAAAQAARSATSLLADPAEAELAVSGSTVRSLPLPVRPGHGLDGPEITSSWPAHPGAGELDGDFEEFWAEHDEAGGYPGAVPGDEADSGARRGRDARAARRRAGRRRGRSNDHRLWLALAAVVVVAVAAIIAIIKLEFPSASGPTHTMVIPASIGTYARTVDLERQADVAALREEVIQMSAGRATGVVSAVYASGNSAAGDPEQILMLIEGHLANAAPAASIDAFTGKFPGATVVSAGSLGGKAACVQEGAGTSEPKSLCVWFDDDSFGEIVSPTMNAASLASAMRTVRPSVELVAATK